MRFRGIFTGPGWKFIDWPLEVGKTWSFSARGFFQQRSSPYDVAVKVQSYEDVKTKAGTFKAFKIQYDWKTSDNFGRTYTWTVTSWFAPEVKNLVKSTSTSSTGREWELVSYSLK